MKLKQEITKFFEANLEFSKKSKSLYNDYKIKSYTFDQSQNQHNLTVIARNPNDKNQTNYQLEKVGDLHPELVKLFPKKYLTEKQDAQEYLNKKYPKEGRNEVEKLNLVGIKELTGVNLSNCLSLEKLYCSHNLLTNINSLLGKVNPKKMKEIDLSHNRFSQTDLNNFSKFVKLETLNISNNFFTGSLLPLKELTKLQELNINNTNIKSEFYNSPAREWLDSQYPHDEDSEEENFGLDLLDEEKNTLKKREEITELDISNQNLQGPLKLKGNQKLLPQDLSILLSLQNLKELNFNQCPFEGSLKPLQNLSKLERLNISDTNISEGLEHLPKSCTILYCNSEYQYKSVKIMEELDKRIKKENTKSELSKLKSPEQFNKFGYLSGVESVSTSTTVLGGALTLLDYSTTGGVIALVAPLIG
ncbi:4664_t:CDS:2, partial [Funneliformis geosporum]